MKKIKAGYKDSKIGIVPNSWLISSLGKLVDITSGDSPSKFKLSSNGIPFFKVEQLNNCNKYQINTPYYIDINSKYIKAGSIIFPKRGASILLNKIRILMNNSFIDTNLMALTIREDKKVLSEFLYYYLLNANLYEIADTTSIPQINNKHIIPYFIALPPKDEQKKIAEILSTWDLAIEKQEQLIEKKKEFKKGLMQRLLSGKVRFKEFKDEWISKALENYIIPVSRECDKPNEGYWRLGLRSHGKGTFHEFVEDPSTVSMDKLYKVKCNDLIVNITFAWEHAIAVANSRDENKLVSHRFPTYEFKENAYPIFFKYYVLQPKFRHMLVNISPGGAGRNRVMNKKDFLNLIVKVPSYDEQVKIAEVLTVADKEIELLQKELEALKLQEKGLMQRLLTGEIRVNI